MNNIDLLLKLARLKLTQKEKEVVEKDLKKILDYVGQLQNVNTDNVKILSNNSFLNNILREDEEQKEKNNESDKLIKQSYDKQDRFFKIPPIMKNNIKE